MNNPTPENIAEEFRKVIAEWLGEDTRRTIDLVNKIPSNAGTCATHNFCDANAAMLEAFENFGIDPLPEDEAKREEMADLWNRAWDIAKAKGFSGKI